jgi:pimeloyl-ACP methyl ester carboxylesterase
MLTLSRLFIIACVVLISAGQAQQTSKADQPSAKKITVEVVKVKYLEQGQGDTVVLIHGAYSDHRGWELQREAVAQGYRYVAPDLRYHGDTPWTDDGAKYSLATHASDLAAFIQQLDAGPVHVVGFSYGSNIALALAVQQPDLIRSLFLYEPALASIVSEPADLNTLGEEGETLGPVVAAVQAGDNAEAVRLFTDWISVKGGSFDALEPSLREVLLENSRTLPLFLTRPDDAITCAQLGEIKVPVTVAKGQNTRPYFEIITDTVHGCIPGSLPVTIPNAHHLGPVENTTAFNTALLSHLKGN